jgi:hypothetical protein
MTPSLGWFQPRTRERGRYARPQPRPAYDPVFLIPCRSGAPLTRHRPDRLLAALLGQVDHVMTNAPGKVKLLTSAVTGRKPVNGFWDSDHNGLFSGLLLS